MSMLRNALDARKAREAEHRRNDIIGIVRRLVREVGVEQVSIRRVAELGGYSTTVVYSLFDGKAALIACAMDQDVIALTQAMKKARQLHDDPEAQLRAIGKAYFEFGIGNPDAYFFVFMQVRPHAALDAGRVRHGDPDEDPYALLRDVFVHLRAAQRVGGDAGDVDSMAQVFGEGIHGMTARQLVFDQNDPWLPALPTALHVETMLEVLLAGIQARFPSDGRAQSASALCPTPLNR